MLPFENIGAGHDREYLADGLTEETIVSLGRIDPQHLSTIGRTSVMVYKRSTQIFGGDRQGTGRGLPGGKLSAGGGGSFADYLQAHSRPRPVADMVSVLR